MSVIAFFAGWTLVALCLAGLGLGWSIRRDQWDEAETVKYALFRSLAAEEPEPAFASGAPTPAALTALAAATALYASGFLLGVSLSLVR